MHTPPLNELGSNVCTVLSECLKIKAQMYERASMNNPNGELSSCDITYSGRVSSREGDIHSLA